MGIATVFLLVMLPLTAVMIGVLYRQNSELAVEVARSAMDRASADTVTSLRGLIGPIKSAVDLWATVGRAQHEGLPKAETSRALMEMLEQLPQVYGLYFGFASDGGFLEVARLPPGTTAMGPSGAPPPPGTRYLLRTINNASGKMEDDFNYYARWDELVGTERAPQLRYDPRRRPWYLSAEAAEGMAYSGQYVFATIDRPGMTLSRRIVTDDGVLVGVFGADILTDSLSAFLDARRIGHAGIIFIFDDDGMLVGYPDPAKLVSRSDGRLTVARVDTVADPIVANAVSKRDAGAGDRFRAPLGEDGEPYLVSFTRLPTEFGMNWTIGIIAEEREFVGPLRRASLKILAVGTLFLVLACLSVMRISRLLTRPIGALIDETRRIRRYELEAPVVARSAIKEINALTEALGTMKAALHSFGRYVPMEIVREIVAKGEDTVVGGSRRPVTIMFTDLEDFTKYAEARRPEDVLDRLSNYFEVMSGAIHDHRGTIDKFIGDSMMALWNAPAYDNDHVANACLAALGCRAAVNALNRKMDAGGFPPFRTRFGLHTGEAVVGNVGSSARIQYTALGAAVNLASRIEGLNKQFGTEILVTGNVEAQVRDRFEFRPFGLVVASGTSIPIEVFELLGTKGERSPYPLSRRDARRSRAWRDAFAAYQRRDWTRARDDLVAFLGTYPEDVGASVMHNNCQEFIRTRPAEDWDGALRFESK